MITKPSLFDTKYQNMNYEETRLNYDRDMMLYEQVEALKQINERNNEENIKRLASYYGDTSSPSYSSYDLSPSSILMSTLIDANISIKKGTEAREKYATLEKKAKRLLDKSAKYNDRSGTAMVIFILAISIGFPAVFIMNNKLFRIAVIGTLIFSILLYLIEKAKLQSITQEIQDITIDIENLIPEEETKPKCYVRKTKKPKKEVLHLETK